MKHDQVSERGVTSPHRAEEEDELRERAGEGAEGDGGCEERESFSPFSYATLI